MPATKADLPASVPAWVRDCPRRFMVGFHVPDYDQVPEYNKAPDAVPILSKFDAKAFVRAIKKAHVQAFWYYNKCHQGNAYYPSKVPGAHVHTAMKGRDLFGEITEACLENGVVPLAIYEFSDHRVMKDKPEWCHRVPIPKQPGDPTDAVQGASVSGACLHGPYGDYAIQQAIETVRNYPVKGYYVDFLGRFNFESWICPHCGEIFRRDMGFEFNGIQALSHAQYVRYVQWHYAQYAAYAQKMRKALLAVRPDLVFVHNLHADFETPSLQNWELAAKYSDYLSADFFALRWGTLHMSWKFRAFSSASRLKPAEALLDALNAVGREFTTIKALDSYQAELWTARATNVAPCSSIMINIDGTWDAHNMALTKKVFAGQIPFEPWLKDMEAVATVGIMRSDRTVEFLPREKDKDAYPDSSHHSLDMLGWCQALIQGHFLWDVVLDHRLCAETLAPLKVLVLPNVACLSARQCEIIADYVKRGGKLIATGATSLYDENAEPRPNFGLAEVFGADFVGGRKKAHEQLRLEDKRLRAKDPWVVDILNFIIGQWEVKPRKGVRTLGAIFSRHSSGAIINQYSRAKAPGLIWHKFGRGEVWYFAGLPGLQYRMIGQDTHRRLMETVLTLAAGQNTPVRLEAPGSVELFAHRQSGKDHLVVNLVNRVMGLSRSDGASFRNEEIAAMPTAGDVVMRFRAPKGRTIKAVYQAPERRRLALKKIGADVAVTLKGLSLHAMVVAEYST